jgi:hypothetical protein
MSRLFVCTGRPFCYALLDVMAAFPFNVVGDSENSP